MRRAVRRGRKAWRALPMIAKVGLGLVAGAIAGGVLYALWRLWFAG